MLCPRTVHPLGTHAAVFTPLCSVAKGEALRAAAQAALDAKRALSSVAGYHKSSQVSALDIGWSLGCGWPQGAGPCRVGPTHGVGFLACTGSSGCCCCVGGVCLDSRPRGHLPLRCVCC